MRLLVLASILPVRRHSKASQVVVASLLDYFSERAVVHCILDLEDISDATAQELKSNFPFVTFSLVDKPHISKGLWRLVRSLVGLFSRSPRYFRRRLKNTSQIVHEIREFGPDTIILFWDSSFEQLVPTLSGHFPLVLYGARPPYMAQMSRNAEQLGSLRGRYDKRALQAEECRHLDRVRMIDVVCNISWIDVEYYRNRGIDCHYVPNTWPVWRDVGHSDSNLSRPWVIANIGRLEATGNSIGLRYLAHEVLPSIDLWSKTTWRLSVCGPGALPNDIALMLNSHPRVVVKGFVPDLDQEIDGSLGFVVLNSTGNYKGSYTRVVVAMAHGRVVVTTPELVRAMPELVPEVNCLVAESGRQVVAQIDRLVSDVPLRRAMEEASLATYNHNFQPNLVFARLLELALKW